jgi:poly(beta-D-mannuronate) lyase
MTRRSLLAMLALMVASHAAHAEALRSPWDAAIATHQAAVASACPPPPALSADIVTADYYSDDAHSVIDPIRQQAYAHAMQPWHQAALGVERMADHYRRSGDAATAACAANWLTRFAEAGALTGAMSTNQSTYVQGWMLGAFAVGWLKIHAATPNRVIPAWLARVADANRAYYARRSTTTDGRNNHRYWAGFAVMAAGIAADRRDLYQWGIDSFGIGVGQVTDSGTLPLEMARRGRALHYHLFAAAPLVAIAELAAANGSDLYQTDHAALPRLVHTAIAGLGDPAPFAIASGASQEPVAADLRGLAWAIPFNERFPDPTLTALLRGLPTRNDLYLGGAPP